MMKINNDIKEDVCSYKIAKILKDLGFDCEVYAYYDETSKLHYKHGRFNSQEKTASAPTFSHISLWLNENFSLFVWVFSMENDDGSAVWGSHSGKWITKDGNKNFDLDYIDYGNFETSVDASEKTYETVLNKLKNQKL